MKGGIKNGLRDEPLNFNHIFVITSHRKMIYHICMYINDIGRLEVSS